VLVVALAFHPEVSTSKLWFPTRSPEGSTLQVRDAGLASGLSEPSVATTWKVCEPTSRSA
jgi:hypothetical protein